MADKLIIDWKQYNLIVEKLAVQIHKSGFKPDMLIGIMRGGAPIIDVLSRVFKLKCAYLAVESYSGEGTEDQQGELGIFKRNEFNSSRDEGKPSFV
jgi:hypoxanthine phosphoribosyltransferase